MKIQSYKMLFRFFSYLSDKSNGRPLFVKYKLLLGTLLIGLVGVSCDKPIQTGKLKNGVAADSQSVRSTRRNAIDSMRKNIKPDIRVASCYFTPPVVTIVEEPIEPMITCYLPAIVDMPEEPSPPKVYTYGETEVPPVSGEGDLRQFQNWVQQNIQYPENMLNEGLQGRVVASFVIDEEGKLTDINILRSLSADADNEARRVLLMSRPWTPGETKGQKIKTKIVVPIIFKLP